MEEELKEADSLLQSTIIPGVSSEKPCSEEDFKDYRCNAEKNLEVLKCNMHQILNRTNNKNVCCKIKTSTITSLLVLCAEHTSIHPWTTSVTLKLSQEILDILCQLYTCPTVGECLVVDQLVEERMHDFLPITDFFKSTLLYLRPKLLKNTWKCYPSAVVAFQWLLVQVQFPHLNLDNHGMVFTTSLIILDDFVSENKIVGIRCLHHYIEHMTSTDFRCQGRDVVVYDALFSHLYTREAIILENLLPCILKCLNKMEHMMTSPDNSLVTYVYQWGKFEDVLKNIFSSMIIDDKLEVRMVYIKFLPQFILNHGTRFALFTNQMISVLDSYLEARAPASGLLIKATLEAFFIFLKTTQPCLPAHCLNILHLLLQKLQDLSSNDTKFEESEEIISLICDNITFLVHSSEVHVRQFSKDFIESLGLNKSASTALMKAYLSS